MNQIINYKKDCILKTYANKIDDITLTHDYKINEDTIEGVFDISGTYKVASSELSEENFMFTLPFIVAISERVNKDTIDLTISDFNYNVTKDILHLEIELNLNYENKEEKLNLNYENKEEELINMEDIINEEDKTIINENEKKGETNNKQINKIVKELNKKEDITKYKVYIVRKEDTIESIAIKYNVDLNTIKEYNNVENIKENDKIIIPSTNEE